jgi:hypothetical protein
MAQASASRRGWAEPWSLCLAAIPGIRETNGIGAGSCRSPLDYQTASYGLNCTGAATDVIAPGASVCFALPVPISHSLATASTDVCWSLGWQPDKHSPTAHQAVRVTG